MATFLEAFGVLQNFSAVFTFLFVFALFYGILSYKKFLGGNNAMNAIVSFVIAILFVLSDTAVKVFEYAAPWFVIIIVFVMMLMLFFMFIGATEGDIADVLKTHTSIVIFGFAFVVIILLFSVGQVYKDSGTENLSDTSFAAKVGGIVQHPKILGVIAILMIAVWAIRLLAEN